MPRRKKLVPLDAAPSLDYLALKTLVRTEITEALAFLTRQPAPVTLKPALPAAPVVLAEIQSQPVVVGAREVKAALVAFASKHGMERATSLMSSLGYSRVSDVPPGKHADVVKALTL